MNVRWAGTDALALFPTFVWRFDLDAELRDRANDGIIAGLDARRPARPTRAWQSTQELHTLGELSELVDVIAHACRGVLAFLKVGYRRVEITACWANVNSTGASHRRHSHPNNYLSGVYYVQVPATANTINFHDPRPQTSVIRPAVTELTSANADQVVVEVTDGTLLLFPAYLEHSIDPNPTDTARISLGFNVMFTAFSEHVSKPLWEPERGQC